jgi:hypothetical protein
MDKITLELAVHLQNAQRAGAISQTTEQIDIQNTVAPGPNRIAY